MKKCSKCKVEKHSFDFHSNISRSDGLCHHCIECRKAYRTAKPQVYTEAQRERRRETNRLWKKTDMGRASEAEYRTTDAGIAAQVRGKAKYRSKPENRAKENEGTRKWRAKNPEKAKAAVQRWNEENADTLAEYAARRRAAKANARVPVSSEEQTQINVLYEKARRLSRETGVPHEVDHIIPLQPEDPSISPGLHILSNLQILTKVENVRKRNYVESK